MLSRIVVYAVMAALFSLFSCQSTPVNTMSGGGGEIPYIGGYWTWMSGSDLINQNGTYGTKCVADALNVPGSREFAAGVSDGSGNIWIFGGYGRDGTGTVDRLNDLWKNNGTNWIWVSGHNAVNQTGVYGTKGVADAANVPGARFSHLILADSSGNMWMFGGSGYDSAGSVNYLIDLWKFNGTIWSWISGSNCINQNGVYGTKGVADAGNIPGARTGATGWIDNMGRFWLFGGYGRDKNGLIGRLNDLWKYDGTNWTWVTGADTRFQAGSYGTRGVADPANTPGARNGCAGFKDSSGCFWLFGGSASFGTTAFGYMNDLWKFDGTNWAWISGTNVSNQNGVYGTKGTADSGNSPGSRTLQAFFSTGTGVYWLYGGEGYDGGGSWGYLNDLWKFDGTNWVWMSGSDSINQSGSYGTKGTADAANRPGARGTALCGSLSSGSFWLFGGNGRDSSGTSGRLNDLWKYEP